MAGLDIGNSLLLQGGSNVRSTYPSANTLFNNIVPNVYIAGGLVIFFMIVFGGFMILANGGNKDKVGEGKKVITSAIIGLLVLFGSYWIIQIIQVLTGVQILNSGV